MRMSLHSMPRSVRGRFERVETFLGRDARIDQHKSLVELDQVDVDRFKSHGMGSVMVVTLGMLFN